MQSQFTTETILEHSDSDDDGKMSWHEDLVTLLQVASAVGFCSIVNLVAL